MTRHPILLAAVFAGLALAAACGPNGPSADPGPEPEVTKEARLKFPTALALQEKVIARSCSPVGGVCHNMKEYPDMHTPGNFVTIADKPCNEDKISDPSQYYDGCEPVADEINIPAAGFHAKVGSMSQDLYDAQGYPYRVLVLEKPAPVTQTGLPATFTRGGATVVSVPSNINLVEGSKNATLTGMYNLDYQTYLALGGVVGGDPNQNGIFGGEHPWREVMPGHSEASYLLGRITGTVPGTRMPLANQALSDAEYVALFCWVETMPAHPTPDDPIDYGRCDFARHPVHYAIGN